MNPSRKRLAQALPGFLAAAALLCTAGCDFFRRRDDPSRPPAAAGGSGGGASGGSRWSPPPRRTSWPMSEAAREATALSRAAAMTGARLFDGRRDDVAAPDAVYAGGFSPRRADLFRGYTAPARTTGLRTSAVPPPPPEAYGATPVADSLVASLATTHARAEQCYEAVATAMSRAGLTPPVGTWNHGTSAYQFGGAYDRDEAGVRERFREVDPVASWPLRRGTVLNYAPGCLTFSPRYGHIEVVSGASGGDAVGVRHFLNESRSYSQIRAAEGAHCVRAFQPVEPVLTASAAPRRY